MALPSVSSAASRAATWGSSAAFAEGRTCLLIMSTLRGSETINDGARRRGVDGAAAIQDTRIDGVAAIQDTAAHMHLASMSTVPT